MQLLGKIFFILVISFVPLSAINNEIKISILNETLYINKPFVLNVNFKYQIDSKLNNIEVFSPKIDKFKILKKSKLEISKKQDYVFGSFRYTLKSDSSGKFLIKPFILSLMKNKNLRITSNNLYLTIKKLPLNAKVIGSYEISSAVEKLKNGVVNLDVVTQGKSFSKLPYYGNNLDIKGVQVFEDRIKRDCEEVNYIYHCKKIVSYSLISEDSYDIPQVEFKYIDMDTNKLIVKKTQKTHIVIVPVSLKKPSNQDRMKVKKDVEIKEEQTALSKSSLFYIFLFFVISLICIIVFIFIYQYKKIIEKSKAKIIFHIESILSNEELYNFLFPYFGLNVNIDSSILLLKNTNVELAKNQEKIIEIIIKEELYGLFEIKKYELIKASPALTLNEKINMFQQNEQYKVDVNSLIDIEKENNVLSSDNTVKEKTEKINFKAYIPYVWTFMQAMSLMSIITFVIALLVMNNEDIAILKLLMESAHKLTFDKLYSTFSTQIFFIIMLIGVLINPIIAFSINFKHKYIVTNMNRISKVMLVLIAFYTVYIIYYSMNTLEYKFSGWIGFILIGLFTIFFAKLFDIQYESINTNKYLLSIPSGPEQDILKMNQLKVVQYIAIGLSLLTYGLLYYFLENWSVTTLIVFVIGPWLLGVLVFELLKRYFVYNVPIQYLFTYKEFKDTWPGFIILFFLLINLEFTR